MSGFDEFLKPTSDPTVEEKLARKTLCLIRPNIPKPAATVWLSDATADRDLLEFATELEIEDATVEGRLKLSKNDLQFPVDFTRKASPSSLQSSLRSVLASRPDCVRVGIITHSTLVEAAKSLGPMFDHRVGMVAHFHSGEDRASNRWLEAEIDLLIVAGTPRIDEMLVKERLLRFGFLDALKLNGDWGELRWQGYTRSGSTRIILGRGYREPTWRRAHQSKVRAGIIQAAGRARVLLETGCDVVILSNEECGVPVAEIGQDLVPLTDSDARVLSELTAVVSLIDIRDNRRCATTRELADRCRLSPRQTRDILSELESRGLVVRLGERSGWRLSDVWNSVRPTNGEKNPASH